MFSVSDVVGLAGLVKMNYLPALSRWEVLSTNDGAFHGLLGEQTGNTGTMQFSHNCLH
jgi:hypothetical protein